MSAAAVALPAHELWPRTRSVQKTTAPLTIIVVGAGIAGLVAAFELLQAGHNVTLLEARMRPGGRMHTIRDSFADGLYAEAGAIDFTASYKLLLQYIRLFDLPVAKPPEQILKNVVHARGQRYLLPPEPDWPFPLNAEERRLGRDKLWEKYVLSAAPQVGDPLHSEWPDARLLEWDAGTLNDFLRKRGVSEGAAALFRVSVNGGDYDHVSALQTLTTECFYAGSPELLKLRGGNDQLPEAFARKLDGRIHYGAAVVKVGQDAHKVRVVLIRSGTQERMEADRGIPWRRRCRKLLGAGIFWWDDGAKGVHVLWCDTDALDNVCRVLSGRGNWEGNDFVLTDVHGDSGKRVFVREVWSDLKRDSFTQTIYQGIAADKYKRF